LAFPRSPDFDRVRRLDLAKFSGGRFQLGLGNPDPTEHRRAHAMPWGEPSKEKIASYMGALDDSCWIVSQRWSPALRGSATTRFTRMQPIFQSWSDDLTRTPAGYTSGASTPESASWPVSWRPGSSPTPPNSKPALLRRRCAYPTCAPGRPGRDATSPRLNSSSGPRSSRESTKQLLGAAERERHDVVCSRSSTRPRRTGDPRTSTAGRDGRRPRRDGPADEWASLTGWSPMR